MDHLVPRIVVVGAGVIGLTTALCLQQEGYRVTILARDWPEDKSPNYASTWAGAQWRSSSEMDDTRTQQWAWRTFSYWRQLGKRVSSEITGIEVTNLPFICGLRFQHIDKYTLSLIIFRHDSQSDVPPEDWIWWKNSLPASTAVANASVAVNFVNLTGLSYDSFSISPSRYLRYLHEENSKLGVHFVRATIRSLKEVASMDAFRHFHGIVNCTGLGAVQIAPDKSVYPTKGQSLIVKGEAACISSVLGDGWESVVVPRSGEKQTFLGVSKVGGDWSLEPDEEVTKMILQRCRSLAPELLIKDDNFEVVAVQVGLRPSRKNGPRVESEVLVPCGPDGPRHIYHNYGHSGAGFEESIGSAERVVEMVKRDLEVKDT
ncbi:MAG: hypothetical protein LQ349_004233 [Xanthoria aureola]|nr:MAG: hypothetical protein LQ349_004233 [Xanthoria aureola]